MKRAGSNGAGFMGWVWYGKCTKGKFTTVVIWKWVTFAFSNEED